MSYVKPLTMAAAMALAFIGTDAHAATPTINYNPTGPQTTTSRQATYYIADYGTPQARKVYYFNRIDRNHDGQLSRSEIPGDMVMLRAQFTYADWNQDNRISPSEYLHYRNGSAPEFVGVYRKFTMVHH